MPNQCTKIEEEREITLLVKMCGSNRSFQGAIHRFKRLAGLEEEEPERKGGRNK
jgi:hypothetical protein